MDNAEIADRLDAFAAVLELGDANPYTIRAYRRAAETVRDTWRRLEEFNLAPQLAFEALFIRITCELGR